MRAMMNGPPSNALDQPQPTKTFTAHVVKVMLATPDNPVARMVSKDGKIDMECPATLSKRFKKGETVGYFRAQVDSDGILELGDRLADLAW
jgi:hypothetical protein